MALWYLPSRKGIPTMQEPTNSLIRLSDRASKGGSARMRKMSRAERSELARKAAKERWQKVKNQKLTDGVGMESSRATEDMPVAKYPGTLNLVGTEIPVYVLSNGQRVIARVAATEILSDVKRGGDLISYIGAESLKPFIDIESA